MIDVSLYAAFLVAAFVLVIIPGPDMMLIIALGARHGPTAGFMAALGVAGGLAVHTAAAALGLSALFTYVPVLYHVLRWAGAAYLVVLAIAAFRDRGVVADEAPTDPACVVPSRKERWRCFRQALITNVLNPKVIIFNVAFLPQFVNPAMGNIAVQLLILGATLVLIDLSIDGPLGLAAGRLGQVLRRQRFARVLNVSCGAIFTALALRLVLIRD